MKYDDPDTHGGHAHRAYFKPGVRTVGVEQWAELTKQGIELPVSIQVHGSSMHPLIRIERDTVTILPLREALRKGEIVLFFNAGTGRYVLHRVIRVSENEIITRGDNCFAADAPLRPEQIKGRAVTLKRGNHTLRLTGTVPCLQGRALAACRHAYINLRRMVVLVCRKLGIRRPKRKKAE